ncbi:MAG: transposase [Candidatus Methylomirabilis sp.]|nr:transposase [Candidatus Methylomirabilis sp.]
MDEFIVMPNHIHGIIIVVGAQFIAPSQCIAPDPTPDHAHAASAINQGAMNRAPTLGHVVRAYKATSTRFIRAAVDPGFGWQRNYYEHIIRDETSLNRIREYIQNNPARWAEDPENPDAVRAQ